jgi:hypothetical protein
MIATFIMATAVGGAGSVVNAANSLPTFGRPTIVGVQSGGNSEPGLRIDSHGRIYVDSPVWPYSAVWRSLDGGATFKWIPAAAARTGRLPTCQQPTGGDSEIATDTADRLYFSDRLAAQASPYNTAARSDDQGATFRSTCNAVASDSTDRPWYAIDGDPLRGGNIYLALAIIGGDSACTPGENLDQLALARSPVPGREPDAGIVFGPLTIATGPCASDRRCHLPVVGRTAATALRHRRGADHGCATAGRGFCGPRRPRPDTRPPLRQALRPRRGFREGEPAGRRREPLAGGATRLRARLVTSADQAVGARTLITSLLDRVADDAAALRCEWALERVETIAAEGTSADRQLRLVLVVTRLDLIRVERIAQEELPAERSLRTLLHQ